MIGSSLYILLGASFCGGIFIGILATSSYYKKQIQEKSTSDSNTNNGKLEK